MGLLCDSDRLNNRDRAEGHKKLFALWVQVTAHRNPFLMDNGHGEIQSQWHEQHVWTGH